MIDRNEEEIYSIMFKSLKHPVRRQILRMLNDKPMPFMEIVELLGVTSSHLTYHLESLGELITKTPQGQYMLSNFGKATASAMRGVQEAPELATRRPKKLTRKWKAIFTVLMVTVLLLSSFGGYQYIELTQLADNQRRLEAENQQLLSWGIGAGTVADMLRDVVQIDTNSYKITLLSNTLEYRSDFAVAEEVLRYSFSGADGNFNVDLRFREDHLSRYQLSDITSTPKLIQNPPDDNLEIVKAALNRYNTYSNHAYLADMRNLLDQINTDNNTITTGTLKLQTTTFSDNTEYLWLYTQDDIDFSAKSLRMTVNNGVLIALTDGYFLFTIANTNVNYNSTQAETIAKNYIQARDWVINGTEFHGLPIQCTVSVEMIPHPRGNSVALVPYWYVVLELDQTVSAGFSSASVGVWADTGEIADVQLLNSN
ncbi:MAG: winged helix-turn-helix domain-containing protein [Candidatus Bathyarchaeia archaeon]